MKFQVLWISLSRFILDKHLHSKKAIGQQEILNLCKKNKLFGVTIRKTKALKIKLMINCKNLIKQKEKVKTKLK